MVGTSCLFYTGPTIIGDGLCGRYYARHSYRTICIDRAVCFFAEFPQDAHLAVASPLIWPDCLRFSGKKRQPYPPGPDRVTAQLGLGDRSHHLADPPRLWAFSLGCSGYLGQYLVRSLAPAAFQASERNFAGSFLRRHISPECRQLRKTRPG